MFSSYFASASNSLLKNRLFTLINVCGLAIGLAACIVIALYVRNETTYDQHWSNRDHLYRVNTTIDATGQGSAKAGVTSLLLKAPLQQYYAEDIELVSRMVQRESEVILGDTRFRDSIPAVDPEFLQLLDFETIEGDIFAALADTNGIALTETLAQKYFPETPALGRTLTLVMQGFTREYTVRAIYRMPPGNTVLDLPALIALDETTLNPLVMNWGVNAALTLVRLREGASIDGIVARFPQFIDQTVDISGLQAGAGVKPSQRVNYELQNIQDIYLDSPFEDALRDGNKTVVLAFSAIALLILLIGCINFTVLSTARATQRAKEVAVRKVVGGNRLQLLVQFMGESWLLVLPSTVLALVLVELTLPVFRSSTGIMLTMPYQQVSTYSMLLGLLLVTSFIGGLYPAIVLSQFRPAHTLKAGRSQAHTGKGLRGALVVFQFSVSIALMIATAVIYAQVHFSGNRDPGFQRDHVMIIDNLLGRQDVNAQKMALKQEILKLPGVRDASLSAHQPMQTLGLSTIHIFYTPEQSTAGKQLVATLSVDHDFFRTWRMPLLAGRDYSQDLDTPTALLRPARPDKQVERSTSNIIINASAARQLGYADVESAVGHQIVADSPDTAKIVNFTVVGVVADTQFFSLRQAPRPEAYILMPGFTQVLGVNYEGSSEQMRENLDGIWKQVMGAAELSLVQVEDSLAREFTKEQQEALMLVSFTALAIIIACLGLFGSAAFTVETRTKEIGVRKVIGAEVREIVTLLLWQFSRPVLVANIIAWPVAIWAMLKWLQRFPYQLPMEQLVLLAAISGLCAMLIAALTVTNSTWRVARSNPVHALRYE